MGGGGEGEQLFLSMGISLIINMTFLGRLLAGRSWPLNGQSLESDTTAKR